MSDPDQPVREMDGAGIVRHVRLREKMTLREFADAMKVTENTVFRWEARKRAVLPRHLQRIEELFGIEVPRCERGSTPP